MMLEHLESTLVDAATHLVHGSPDDAAGMSHSVRAVSQSLKVLALAVRIGERRAQPGHKLSAMLVKRPVRVAERGV